MIGSDFWWGWCFGVGTIVVPLIVVYVWNVYRLTRWRARHREIDEWDETHG